MKRFIIYVIGFVLLSATLPQCKDDEPREVRYGAYKITAENNFNIKMTLFDVYVESGHRAMGVNMLDKTASTQAATLTVERNIPPRVRVQILNKCMEICDSTLTLPALAVGESPMALRIRLNADSTLTIKLQDGR